VSFQPPDAPQPPGSLEALDVIVLAAGRSSRFGRNKLLQRFGGRTVLERVLAAAHPVAHRIILVTGFDAERVRAVAERAAAEAAAAERGVDVDPAYNPCYDLGMFSSIQRGVKEVTTERFAVVPGDLPLLRREDFEAVLSAKAAAVVRPRYRGTPGHPVLMSAELIPRISSMPPGGSMPEVHAHYDVTYVDVDRPSVCADIDTVADYESLRRGEAPE
jgi:molybdenum cofactor cytidylyltransferase